MQSPPSMRELIEAVQIFIDETASPGLSGHAKFHARVASNVLSIVLRELEYGPEANADQTARLTDLLDASPDQPLEQLNKTLCEKLSNQDLGLQTPDLLEHLKITAIAQLKIDQPGYSGLKTALESSK